ncbi:MAG: HdeD family acid-resistance protein [Actinomycetia bacterium]|nr:HdeD family acid-resistance protein [Actinomycetes bacterium]
MSIYSTPASPQLDPDNDLADLIGRLGKNWGLFLFFGVLTVGLGIAIVVWPQVTVGIVAILLGAWLLVSGVFSLVSSFATADADTASRVMMGIVGALSILLGILCFRSIYQAVEILALFVGIGWLMRGVFDLVGGAGAKGQSGRGLAIFMGLLGIAAGIVVLVWPGITLTALAWVSGIWLIVLGLVWVIASFRLRSEAKKFADPTSG